MPRPSIGWRTSSRRGSRRWASRWSGCRAATGSATSCAAAAPGARDGPGILMIAHADTVHPVGTLADKLPIRREGDKCFGPAIYDMKGGTVIALAALKAVIDAGKLNLPVTIIINPDEEIGSPTSRQLIEAEAQAPQVRADPGARQGRARRGHDRPARLPALLPHHPRPPRALRLDQQGWPLGGARHGPDRRGAGEPLRFRQGSDLRGQRLPRRAVGELRADDLHGAGAVRARAMPRPSPRSAG